MNDLSPVVPWLAGVLVCLMVVWLGWRQGRQGNSSWPGVVFIALGRREAAIVGTAVVLTFTQHGQLRLVDPAKSSELFVVTAEEVDDIVGPLGLDLVDEPVSWTKFGEMVLRRGGKGLPDVNGYGRGDELVVVDITIPSKLSAEEKRLVEQLAQQPGFQHAESVKNQNIFERMKSFFR